MADRLLESLTFLTAALSGAVLLVVALRRPGRRLAGSTAIYWTWLLVPAALIAVLAPAIPHHSSPTSPPLLALSQPALSVSSPHPPTGDLTQGLPEMLHSFAYYLLGVWALGCAAFLAGIVLLQRKYMVRLGRLTPDPFSRRVFYSQKAGIGPSVVGLLPSRIILPADFASLFEPAEQRLILAHERTHVRERHPIAGAAALGFLAIQWFNPLAYLALTLFRIDQELACDAAVVAAHPGERATYAKAMLKACAESGFGPPLGYCWSGALALPMTHRIGLLRDRPPTFGRRVMAGAVLTLLLSASAATEYALAPHAELGLNLRRALSPAAPGAAPTPAAASNIEAKPISTKARASASPAPTPSSVPQPAPSVVPGIDGAVASNPAAEVANPGLADLDERSQRLYYALAAAAARGENVSPPVIRWTTTPSGQTVARVGRAPTSRDPLNFDDLNRVEASVD